MKILINTGRFNGGAPLSILEYAKIAKKNGHAVIAIGEYSTSQQKYMESGIKTFNIPYFSIKRIIRNFISIKQLINIINDEKPDIIHATSYGIVPSKFVAMIYKIPIMFSVAGGKAPNHIFENEKLIVYSQENKNDLKRFGINGSKIDVISNRLKIDDADVFDTSIYKETIKDINLLLISRLDEGVIKSVYNIIDITVYLASHFENLTLTIIGNGELHEIITSKADAINKKADKEIIKVMGFVDSPRMYIYNSHLVFGKGRSIIESILNNRISFVIGENNDISICSTESVSNLYEYNFSGRNIGYLTDIDDIIKIIERVLNGNINLEDLYEIREIVDNLYNIKHIEDKILAMYQDCFKNEDYVINSSKIGAVRFIIKYYVKELINKEKWSTFLKKMFNR